MIWIFEFIWIVNPAAVEMYCQHWGVRYSCIPSWGSSFFYYCLANFSHNNAVKIIFGWFRNATLLCEVFRSLMQLLNCISSLSVSFFLLLPDLYLHFSFFLFLFCLFLYLSFSISLSLFNQLLISAFHLLRRYMELSAQIIVLYYLRTHYPLCSTRSTKQYFKCIIAIPFSIIIATWKIIGSGWYFGQICFF